MKKTFFVLAVLGAVLWSSGAMAQVNSETVTPSSCGLGNWYAEYFSNPTWVGAPTYVRCENSIPNYDWGSGSPAPSIPADNFSVRWTSSQVFVGGNAMFTMNADDGVHLSVDGAQTAGSVTVAPGTHTVVIESFETTGHASVNVSWTGGTKVVQAQPAGTVAGAAVVVLSHNLGYGNEGSDVLLLQQALVARSFLASNRTTGFFGWITEAAVKKFQAASGISQTGFVGPLTRAALGK